MTSNDNGNITLFPAIDYDLLSSEPGDLPAPDFDHLVGLELPLPWERASRALYHAALVYRMRADDGRSTPEEESWRVAVLDALREIEWRPFVSSRGVPDYNCWSNGYFPGAWGLLGGEVETFHSKGTHSIRHLPDARHWKKRSTNHGIVILASYLVGAKALGQDLVGRDLLRVIIRESCEEGCYPEGINYLSFILSELGPYLAAGWDGRDWRAHVAAELPGLEGAKRHLRLATDLTGQIRNTFGDAKAGVRLFRNGVRIADSLSGEGDLFPLLGSSLRADNRLAPIASVLPSGGQAAQSDYLFSNNIATARGANWWLWVLGSKVHLTHNCDHDCGSFLFQTGDIYVGELPGRQAWCHNVPLLKDAPHYPLCEGPFPFHKRGRHGTLTELGKHSWRVVAPRSFDGCPTSIRRHVRDLHVVDGFLVVLDRVYTDGPGEPVIQFMTTELSSLYGHEVFDSRVHCRMAKAKRGWVSASVVGAKVKLHTNSGVIFRGQKFAFPA